VYLLDTLGDLPVHYAASDIAFVGGSLLPFGGHNVLEPASIGIPVITGEHTQNFSEINELLLGKGAEWKVSDAGQLSEKVNVLLSDGNLRHRMGQQGKMIVEQYKGCTDRILELITEKLDPKITF